MFNGYRIFGLRFDPPNPKHLLFESLWVKKAIFIHIWITRRPIPIPFLLITLFRYVGGVTEVSLRSDLRFAFWPPKSKKLSFWMPFTWKSCFLAYLDNRESDSHSVSSYNFLQMSGRLKSCFMAIGSAVCFLTSQIQKTQCLKAFELKKLFSSISK